MIFNKVFRMIKKYIYKMIMKKYLYYIKDIKIIIVIFHKMIKLKKVLYYKQKKIKKENL